MCVERHRSPRCCIWVYEFERLSFTLFAILSFDGAVIKDDDGLCELRLSDVDCELFLSHVEQLLQRRRLCTLDACSSIVRIIIRSAVQIIISSVVHIIISSVVQNIITRLLRLDHRSKEITNPFLCRPARLRLRTTMVIDEIMGWVRMDDGSNRFEV